VRIFASLFFCVLVQKIEVKDAQKINQTELTDKLFLCANLKRILYQTYLKGQVEIMTVNIQLDDK
jgi:hypothetical protein